jgi:hypothetical protein
MNRAEKLQSKMQELLEQVTLEDHSSWLGHPCTKLMLAGLEYDEETLVEAWINGNLVGDDLIKAQGVVRHSQDLRQDMRHMLAEKFNA